MTTSNRIWNFWSRHYESLWVQGLSLAPTRDNVIRELEAIIKDKSKAYRILDIGCGTGQLLNQLSQVFSDYDLRLTGLDFSEGMIVEAKKKNPAIAFYHMNVEDLEAKTERYDILICTHSFPYYDNQEKAIVLMKNMLVKDGILLLAQASANSLYDSLAMFLVKITTGKANYLSVKEMRRILSVDLYLSKLVRIRTKWFMPSIYLFLMKKVV
ncbi:MAG: methyltransferase domain-containing protein [Dethiosulfatibacter sp.]|nr:methyltransferase domain-containing protein [Dethiosulfatibacter sp.]